MTDHTTRQQIDAVRLRLLDAFMSEDFDTYSQCVTQLETLIGVPHGDRNPKANGTLAMQQSLTSKQRNDREKKRIEARWGSRSLDAESVGGVVAYTVKYKK